MNRIDELMLLADQYAHIYSFVGDNTMPIARQALRAAIEQALKDEREANFSTAYRPIPKGYEIHELPADYTGRVWIESQVRSMCSYATPQWVSLTDDEIEDILGESVELLYSGNFKAIRAIEAKLKEKNNVS
jgi:hypothetical protein